MEFRYSIISYIWLRNAKHSGFLADFKPKTHAIVFYDNQDDILFNHLKFGAESNQGLAYVCSEERPLEIQKEMRKFGIEVDALRERNRLAINNYDRIYIVNHQVNIPTIMSAFADLSRKYISMGLDGMRAAAEMSCFFKEGKVKELIDYEYAPHRKFSFPAEELSVSDLFADRYGFDRFSFPKLSLDFLCGSSISQRDVSR
jgi:hypothetical protein